MTETLTMNMGAFKPLTFDEALVVDGGGIVSNAVQVTAGIVLVTCAPIVAASLTLTTVGLAAPAAVVAGLTMASAGFAFLGNVYK